MLRPRALGHLTARLFALYAVASAIPIVALGFILAADFRSEARQRGINQAKDEAQLIAQTDVEPLLDGRTLRGPLDGREAARLDDVVGRAIGRDVLRLRLRSMAGWVVFSNDNLDFDAPPDPDAMQAVHGHAV